MRTGLICRRAYIFMALHMGQNGIKLSVRHDISDIKS